jgi:hypothetical protein
MAGTKPKKIHAISRMAQTALRPEQAAKKAACGLTSTDKRPLIVTSYEDLVSCKNCQTTLGTGVL